MKLMETCPFVATPNLSSGCPSESTIVARTVIVPSLAIAALWTFTTTPVFPRDVVLPFRLVALPSNLVLKSTVRLTGRSSAEAVLKKTTEARANAALAKTRHFLIEELLSRAKGSNILFSTACHSPQSATEPAETRKEWWENPQWSRKILHIGDLS